MRSCAGWGQKCPADETYPNCVNGLPYIRDKDRSANRFGTVCANRKTRSDRATPRPQPDAQLVRLFELFVRLYAAQKGADLEGKLSALTLRWGNQNNQSVGIKDGGVTRQRRWRVTPPSLMPTL